LEAQDDDASVRASLAVDSLSKVFVVCDQNPAFGVRSIDDCVVAQATGLVEDGEYFVALLAELAGHRWAGVQSSTRKRIRGSLLEAA
jgi:hypothetical protein